MIKQYFSRIITAALFTAVIAGSWDAWWHGAMGRDSFLEPAHIVLYLAVTLAIVLGLYGWRKMRENVWRNLAFVLVVIPAVAPLDELWHRFFGVENLTSPLVLWSPPHLALIFSLLTSIILVLPVLKKDCNTRNRFIFEGLAFSSIITLLLLVTTPLHPIHGWGLLGFAGVGIIALFYFIPLLIVHRRLGVGAVWIVTALVLVTMSIGFNEQIAPGIDVRPHDHVPPFLTVFSMLIPAFLLEVLAFLPGWLRSGVAGLAWAGLEFGFSSSFFEPAFQFGFFDAFLAICSTIIFTIIAGFIVQKTAKYFL